jgi:hypothetical protein
MTITDRKSACRDSLFPPSTEINDAHKRANRCCLLPQAGQAQIPEPFTPESPPCSYDQKLLDFLPADVVRPVLPLPEMQSSRQMSQMGCLPSQGS